MSRFLIVVLLTLVYLFTLASFQIWDIAFGIGFSLLSLWLFREFMRPEADDTAQKTGPSIPARIVAFPRFCIMVAWDIARGTWQVAIVVLGRKPLRAPGMVTIPIGERTRIGVVVSAIVTTLSPGTMLIEINWTDRTMILHVLDATDPDAVRRDHQHFYEQYQKRVFP